MGRLIEGLWDCEYCGTTQIGGSKRDCPNCGKPRGENTTFYIGNSPNRYVPIEQAGKINRNPDWLCEHCDSLNSDSVSSCVSCGAPRTADNMNYFENKEKREEKKKKQEQNSSYEPYCSNYRDSTSETSYNNTRTQHSCETKSVFSDISSFFAETWKTMLIILLIAIGILGMVFLLQPKEYELFVTELSWERSINVERYQTVEESDWFLPSGGRLQYTRSEYSHSEQVLDHYETKTRQVAKERISGYETYVSGHRDLGNGYFEEITSQRPIYETYYETETYQEPVYRSEPVYRTRYYYEIDKWLYERSVTTKGTNSFPYWGETNLEPDERESSRTDTYTVKGTELDSEEVISFALSFEDWSTLKVGQNLKVEISFGHGEIIE